MSKTMPKLIFGNNINDLPTDLFDFGRCIEQIFRKEDIIKYVDHLVRQTASLMIDIFFSALWFPIFYVPIQEGSTYLIINMNLRTCSEIILCSRFFGLSQHIMFKLSRQNYFKFVFTVIFIRSFSNNFTKKVTNIVCKFSTESLI